MWRAGVALVFRLGSGLRVAAAASLTASRSLVMRDHSYDCYHGDHESLNEDVLNLAVEPRRMNCPNRSEDAPVGGAGGRGDVVVRHRRSVSWRLSSA